MKTTFALVIALTFSAYVQASNPQVVISPIDHVFVPNGFDNNDNVEVVITGTFPNPCYTRNKVEVQYSGSNIFILVSALKKDDPSKPICEPMAVPYKEVVSLGNLQGGRYQIYANRDSRYEQREYLNVETSTSTSVDDYIYPIVEYVDLGFTGGLSGNAMLVYKTPSDCIVLDRVEYTINNKDTISVLPIMKKVSQDCNQTMRKFEVPISFNLRSFSHPNVLVFVRSIEGRAVSTIINR